MGRRGVVWFVQPCVGVVDLKWQMKWQISLFQKFANEAERKYPKNLSKFFAILASPNFQNLVQLARKIAQKSVVRNGP